jgi:hypothetical protein
VSSVDPRLERALARLDELAASRSDESFNAPRNEAATRLDLIDALLLDVLDWPRAQVRPEEHGPAGYADYVLGSPQRQLVVEAKREGHVFNLPPETPRIAPLPTLFRLAENLEADVEQARAYAASFGLQYAAVANGHQLVAFLAVRIDGVQPLTGKALAFPSLDAMREGFSDLWNGLSRHGVEGRRLSAMLAGEPSTAPPTKPSVFIPGYLEQLEPFIAEHFIAALNDDYKIAIFDSPFARDVYAEEIEAFRRGPWGELSESDPDRFRVKEVEHLASLLEDREAHLRRSLKYLAAGRTLAARLSC